MVKRFVRVTCRSIIRVIVRMVRRRAKRIIARLCSASTAPLLPSVSGSGKSKSWTREVRAFLTHCSRDQTSRRIFAFLCLNFCFMFVEMLYGYLSNSLGLISDAGHMLFDCTALGIGLYASYVSKIKSNTVYTYGYNRYEILSGYVNGVFLLFIAYFIFVESIERLFNPQEVKGENLVFVSVFGLCVNLVGLFFFHDHHGGHGHSHGGGHGHSHGSSASESHDEHECESGANGHNHSNEHNDHGHSHSDHGHAHSAAPTPASTNSGSSHTNHNLFAIYLHILADTLGSVGVICSSLLIKYYNITIADSICSIIISVLIVGSTVPLLKSTLQILVTRVPETKEHSYQSALTTIQSLSGVREITSNHLWLFSDSELVCTVHLLAEASVDEQALQSQVTDILKGKRVGVNHLTVQIEKEKFVQAQKGSTSVTASAPMQQPQLTSG